MLEKRRLQDMSVRLTGPSAPVRGMWFKSPKGKRRRAMYRRRRSRRAFGLGHPGPPLRGGSSEVSCASLQELEALLSRFVSYAIKGHSPRCSIDKQADDRKQVFEISVREVRRRPQLGSELHCPSRAQLPE